MKALGILLVWLGYSFFVYGVDKTRKNCTSYKTVAWPSKVGGDLTVACAGASSSGSSTPQEQVGGGGPGVAPNPDYSIGNRDPYAAFGGGGGPGYPGQKLPNPNNPINPEPHPGR